MSFEKHNRSSCVIPAGYDRSQLKNKLRRTTLSERERSVCRIVLDTATTWVLTARFIYESAGFSPTTWQRTRDLLVARGLLVTDCERLTGGERRWHLNFDFTGLAAGMFDTEAELPTEEPKKNDHARAHVITHGGVIARSAGLHGSRDPHTQGDLHHELLTQTEPPPAPVAALGLTETEIGERLPGLSEPERRRVAAALGHAGRDQIEAFVAIFSVRRDSARDPAALAVALARAAARGELRAHDSERAPGPESASAGAAVWRVLAEHTEWRGHLVGPGGLVATACAGDAGLLRAVGGALFAPAESAELWAKCESGELDFASTGGDQAT